MFVLKVVLVGPVALLDHPLAGEVGVLVGESGVEDGHPDTLPPEAKAPKFGGVEEGGDLVVVGGGFEAFMLVRRIPKGLEKISSRTSDLLVVFVLLLLFVFVLLLLLFVFVFLLFVFVLLLLLLLLLLLFYVFVFLFVRVLVSLFVCVFVLLLVCSLVLFHVQHAMLLRMKVFS